jgi:hypothetical protein
MKLKKKDKTEVTQTVHTTIAPILCKKEYDVPDKATCGRKLKM